MAKKEIEEHEKIFNILKTGSNNEIKEAKKRLGKMWHADSKSFQYSGAFILKTITEFDCIADASHKAAVISGMDLFFLALGDEYFEELKNFVLKNLQDSDGRVREAARKVFRWLSISLSSRAEPFVFPLDTPLSSEQKTQQLQARKQYIAVVKEIETLIDRYDTAEESVDFIDEMKPSINKSLQMLWSDLTDSPVYRKVAEESRPIPTEIFVRRKEIEAEIKALLSEGKIFLDVDYIKQLIYTEDAMTDLHDIITLFIKASDKSDENSLQNIVQLAHDAWNYFPHKNLNGLSPVEKISEYSF